MSFPTHARHVVVGAGSMACRPPDGWPNACGQSARASAPTSLCSCKTAIAAGASGIACGVVRDNYMWCSALAFCQESFSGQTDKFRKEPSGGLGCFTPDSFPVFDTFCENVHIVADSNHGFKMIRVGHLVADEMMGEKQTLLEPFRFSRYAEGRLHPTSNSFFPWI